MEEQKQQVKTERCDYCRKVRPVSEMKRVSIRRNRRDELNWYCADSQCASFAQMSAEG